MADRVRALTDKVNAAVDPVGRGALPDLVALVGSTERVITLADPDAARCPLPGGGPGESAPLPDVFAEVLPLYRVGSFCDVTTP